jgi:hypothetical protein
MKKVFTHENRMIVYNMRNLLQGEGIETVMKNEFSGGGVGDLPAFDTWPEVWVRDETQTELAQSILSEVTHPKASEDWFCGSCRETNDAAFRLCWNCGQSYE